MAWAWVMACWMEEVDVMLETILENRVLTVVSLIIVATSAAACSAAWRSPPLAIAAKAALTTAALAIAATTPCVSPLLALELIAVLRAVEVIKLA
jgi:hypothetical protein